MQSVKSDFPEPPRFQILGHPVIWPLHPDIWVTKQGDMEAANVCFLWNPIVNVRRDTLVGTKPPEKDPVGGPP